MWYNICANADGLKRKGERVMKKAIKLALFLCLIALISVLMLTACDITNVFAKDPQETTQETTISDETTPEETTPEETPQHLWSEWIVIKEAKCEEKGLLHRYCTKCYYTESKPIDALGHTEVIDKAVAPTCTKNGSTEGKHCSTCNEVFVAREIINSFGHTEVIDRAVAPTRTETGLTEGKHCSVCNEVFIAQEIIPFIGSAGLSYAINSDETTCTITGIGNCTDTDIYIPVLIDGYEVTGIGESAFYNCTNLTGVTIGNSVITIGKLAFWNCNGLTSVTIPSSVTTIGEQAFVECDGLVSVTIPDSVATIGDLVFVYCRNLTSIIVDENNVAYQSINGNLYSKDGAVLVAYASGKTDTNLVIPDSVTTIGYGAFAWCYNFTSVTIGKSVTTIGDFAFFACGNLTSIIFDGTVAQWVSIEKGSDWDDFIGEYTIYCTDGEIAKNGTVTSHSAGLQYTFENNPLLGRICIITGIGTCADSDIIIPPMIDNAPVTMIGENAFNDIDTITSITLPSTLYIIKKFAFWDCGNLTKVVMPNVTSIEEGAFGRCISLNDIALPNSLIRIGISAFGMCTSLNSIIIPYNVSKIGSHAFQLSDNLTIYCETDSQPFGWSDDWNFCNYVGGYCPVIWDYRVEGDTTIRHTFGDWYVETEATETEGKVMRRDCQNCDYYETYAFNKIKVYYGVSSSDNLVDANGLSAKYIDQKEETTTVIANDGEYIYYYSPSEYEECTFFVGGWQGGFCCLGQYSLEGIDYYVYRSNNPNLGEVTFRVC